MPEFATSFIVVGIATLVILDFLFLRWLRRRPGRKFELSRTPAKQSGSGDTPPCWPYGWPGEE